jgi:RNA polymerase sigma factor (sigma-70 family)
MVQSRTDDVSSHREDPTGADTASKVGRPWRGRDSGSLSDEALIAGMADRDERAGLAFVRRHQRRIFGIAFAIVNDRTVAEDVAQEAFLRVWRHAAVFDPRRSSVLTWTSRITRNLAIDALRLHRAFATDPNDVIWAGLMSEEATLDDRAVHADEITRAGAALRELPTEQRHALVRSTFYGQSAQEIADAEQIPLGTAKSRIRIGLDKVRDALAKEGS